MLRLRPYNKKDAGTILSWCREEEAFYKWTAGVLGKYPLTEEQFNVVLGAMPFVAFEDSEPVGFFNMRLPEENFDTLRIGFVIVDPAKRGMGYGKEMLKLGLRFAFEIYGANKATLGVFENNPSAYYCYKAVGFEDIPLEDREVYSVLGQEWNCLELKIEKKN
ncbi:MAG: GNAT family N-acetyltransferase [Lachnospiraceae bacterium]|nr:GNAT family N-acetyltransferase [Lachnospiraceae bacterium]